MPAAVHLLMGDSCRCEQADDVEPVLIQLLTLAAAGPIVRVFIRSQ